MEKFTKLINYINLVIICCFVMTGLYRRFALFALGVYSLLSCSGTTYEYKGKTDNPLGICLNRVCEDELVTGIVELQDGGICVDSLADLCNDTGKIEEDCRASMCGTYENMSDVNYEHLVDYGASCVEALDFLCR
jgi:hypothetical protein